MMLFPWGKSVTSKLVSPCFLAVVVGGSFLNFAEHLLAGLFHFIEWCLQSFGHLLNLLYLIQSGLLDITVLYLSHYVLRRRGEYYERLMNVTRQGAWESWILYMLDALEETAVWTRDRILTVRDLMAHTADFMRESLPRIYSRELCEVIFTRPYCRIADLGEAGIAKRQTASVYLKELVRIGILREEAVGRDKLFLHPKFLRLLTTDDNTFSPTVVFYRSIASNM